MTPLSSFTAITELSDGTEARAIYFNERFSGLSQNLDQLNSDLTGFSNFSNQAFNVVHYGAVGNSTTDDTLAIQAAIDAASVAGGGTVIGRSDHTYLLTFQSTKTTVTGSGGTNAHQYCLDIPSDIVLDLQGGWLKLDDGQNAAMLINRSTNSSNNTNITIRNTKFDGNRSNQTDSPEGEQAALFFWGVNRLTLKDIYVKDAREFAGRIRNVSQGYFDNLTCETSEGKGWAFGLSTASQEIRNSHFGRIFGSDVSGGASGNDGNPFIADLYNCTIDSITASNCSAAIKIQGSSADVAIGNVVTLRSLTQNSGLKIQGNLGDSLFPLRISVANVISHVCEGQGLYIQDTEDVNIGSYSGFSNAMDGAVPDVWLAGYRTSVGIINSRLANQQGVLIRSDATDIQIGSINVSNTSGHAVVVSTGASGNIHSIIARDDRGTPQMTRGLTLSAADANVVISHFTSSGATDFEWTSSATLPMKRVVSRMRVGFGPTATLFTGTTDDDDSMAQLIVSGSTMRVDTSFTPASGTASGATGDIVWDSGFAYICTSTDSWSRTALSTF